MTTDAPASQDEALVRILTELGSVRADLQDMRAQNDSRHRTLANDVLEIRTLAARAVETANEAKRIADRSAHDTTQMQSAVMKYTEGLAAKQTEQAATVAEMKAVNDKQTVALDTLVTAENERQIREKALAEQDEKRWKWIGRVWPIATAIVAIAGYVIGHWKP